MKQGMYDQLKKQNRREENRTEQNKTEENRRRQNRLTVDGTSAMVSIRAARKRDVGIRFTCRETPKLGLGFKG
jgi:hypothetical protein